MLTTMGENQMDKTEREGEIIVICIVVVRKCLSGTLTFEQYLKETKKSIKLLSGGKFSMQW